MTIVFEAENANEDFLRIVKSAAKKESALVLRKKL